MSNLTMWHDTRLKNLFVSVRNGIWGEEPDNETDVFCARGTDFDRIAGRISESNMPRRSVIPSILRSHQLQRGDLVLEKSGGSAGQPVGSVALFDLPIRAVCSNFNARLRVNDSVDPRFACYKLNNLYWSGFTRQFIKQTTGIQNLDASEFLSQHSLLPPLDEQRRIADLLDAETARIDSVMESRRAQISALIELELARIGHHLSGTDVNSTRHSTPWKWLPHIPDDWTIGPVYAYFDIQLGKMLSPVSTSGTRQHTYLRNANIHWHEVDVEDLASMEFKPDEQYRYALRAGDLLVCEGGAGVGEAAVWDGRLSPCFYQKSLHRVRRVGHVPVEWLMYWLRFAKSCGVFEADGNLATIPHLTGEQLTEYRIPIPVDGDRRVAELVSEIANIRKVQAEIVRANALLVERRHAIIGAAVTGQVDATTTRPFEPVGGAVA